MKEAYSNDYTIEGLNTEQVWEFFEKRQRDLKYLASRLESYNSLYDVQKASRPGGLCRIF